MLLETGEGSSASYSRKRGRAWPLSFELGCPRGILLLSYGKCFTFQFRVTPCFSFSVIYKVMLPRGSETLHLTNLNSSVSVSVLSWEPPVSCAISLPSHYQEPWHFKPPGWKQFTVNTSPVEQNKDALMMLVFGPQ